MKLPWLLLQIKYACQTLKGCFLRQDVFTCHCADKQQTKLGKISQNYFHIILFASYIVREDVYGVGFAFVGAIFERMSIFSPNKTLLSTHLNTF